MSWVDAALFLLAVPRWGWALLAVGVWSGVAVALFGWACERSPSAEELWPEQRPDDSRLWEHVNVRVLPKPPYDQDRDPSFGGAP